MASVMEIVVRAQDMASSVMEQVGDAAATGADAVRENWGKASVALGAAGAALEGAARSQAPLTEGSRRLAARLGENEEAVRGWANEISNVTFPMESAINLMEEAARQGLRSKDDIQTFAATWDTIGDATGENADQLAAAGVALRGVGLAAGDEQEAMAAFGFITDNTTGSVGQFLQFLDRAGPDLREMGADVNDSAAILGVLENELGMSGRTARTEFRQAITEADGDMGKLMETLGVSADQFEEYRGKVDESSGVIQRNADIHAESYTAMQRVQHAASELMNRHAGLIQTAGDLALPLMALGPVTRGVVGAFDLASKASGAMKGAFTSGAAGANILAAAKKGLAVASNTLGKAMAFLAANPVVLVIVAIAALAAGIVLLWKHSETFRRIVLGVWEKVQQAIDVAWRNVIQPAWEGIKKGIDVLIEAGRRYLAAWKAVFRGVGNTVKWVWENFIKPQWDAFKDGLDALQRAGAAFGRFWSDLWNGVKATVRSVVSPIVGFLNTIILGAERVGNAIAGAINAIPDVNIPNWVPGIGGRSFGIPHIGRVSLPRIPSFHTGGVFRAPPGRREGLATLLDNELIVNRDGTVASGGGFDEIADLLRAILKLLAEALNRPAIAHVSIDELGGALHDQVRRSQGS